jgi:hypothetical protein
MRYSDSDVKGAIGVLTMLLARATLDIEELRETVHALAPCKSEANTYGHHHVWDGKPNALRCRFCGVREP